MISLSPLKYFWREGCFSVFFFLNRNVFKLAFEVVYSFKTNYLNLNCYKYSKYMSRKLK